MFLNHDFEPWSRQEATPCCLGQPAVVRPLGSCDRSFSWSSRDRHPKGHKHFAVMSVPALTALPTLGESA